jgi:hypothetical protein
MYMDGKTDKQNAVYPYKVILSGHKKEGRFDTSWTMHKRSWSQNHVSCDCIV